MVEYKDSAFITGTLEEKLRKLRDEWSDETPRSIVHSTSRPNRYKVRRQWFQGLVAVLSLAIEDRQIQDHEVKEKVEGFLNRVTSADWKARPLTNPKDVEVGNQLINLVLGEKK